MSKVSISKRRVYFQIMQPERYIKYYALGKSGYIGKSKRNMTTRRGEHDNSIHDFEAAKHLNNSTTGQS